MVKKRKKTNKELYETLYYGKPRRRGAPLGGLFRTFRLLFILGVFGLLGGILMFIYFAKDLPDPATLDQIDVSQSTKIYDREGNVVLYDVYGEVRRNVVPFDEISNYLKQATIAIEDDGFYSHPGIDIKAIARATIHNIFNRDSIQGGSTITQQFIKNAILTPERTLTRKIKEIILATELERRYSKDEILDFYLNQVPYGSVAYGAEAASQIYFATSAKDLSLAEAATLAALTKAPTYYSPYGSNPEALTARKDIVLEKMVELGFITEEEKQNAKKEELTFSPHVQNIQAPHFVMFVREYLERTYGKETLEKGGLNVYTTLDVELQGLAEEAIAEFRETNKKQFGATNAALAALNPKTGHILAMVGSVDYYDIENDGNVNVTVRERQPGSAFKPLAYAVAFEKGYTPKTIIFDVPTEFAVPGTKSYQPQNYDEQFRGPVRMEVALAQSLNVPSVKTLYLAGVTETIDFAKQMGITTLRDPSRYGLSLVLGGGEVKLLELVSAFGVFGQEGIRHPVNFISRIETKEGEILEEFENTEESVLSQETSRNINRILASNALRAPMFGSHSALEIAGHEIAAKTGTTQEYRDAWTVGYTPSLAAGVWAGNNDNTAMYGKAAGVYAASPIWNYFMERALEKFPYKPFIKPQEETTQKPVLDGEYIIKTTIPIDSVSGKRATTLTPPHLIKEKIIKAIHSILYWVAKDDPRGDVPGEGSRDPQFDNWERATEEWIKQSEYHVVLAEENENTIPGVDDVHTKDKIPEITIKKPSPFKVVSRPTLTLIIEIKAVLGVAQFDMFLGDRLIGSYFPKNPAQTNYTYHIPLPIEKTGLSPLIVRVFDKAGNKSEDTILIIVR